MLKLKWHDILPLAISAIIVFATTIYIVAIYPSLPEQIVTNTNFDGTTSMGSKTNIIPTIVLEWIMLIVMIVTTIFPKFWNTKRYVMKNAMKSTFITAKMLELTTLGMTVLFSYTTLMTATVVSYNNSVLIAILAFISIVTIVGTVLLTKIK